MLKHTFYDTTGSLFEEALSDAIGSLSRKVWGNGAFVTSSIEKDQYQGTDFTVLGVPMDVTVNISGKNNTKWFKTKLDLGVGKVQFGIRFGNGRVKFDTPVLILGFDFGEITKQNATILVDCFRNQLQDILETGMDLYFDGLEVA